MGILDDLFGAAKSFDNAMSNFVHTSAAENFGTKYRRETPHLTELYRALYYAFGLTSPHLLNPSVRVPLRVHSGWDSHLNSFEIRGNTFEPHWFTGYKSSIFHTIIRNWPPAKNGAWAFDISRLHEGVLSGQTRINRDETYLQSEEHLKVLRLIGSSSPYDLVSVPKIGLLFGPLWKQFGIPDRIDFQLNTVRPLGDRDLLRIVDLISNTYNRNGAPVSFSYSGNPATGTMTMTPMEDVQQPYVPPTPPQSQEQHQAKTEQGPDRRTSDFLNGLNDFVENHAPKPADGFPYEFYRGLGLIDNEDMVLVPTIMGDMRVHMTTDEAKLALLKHQPKS